MKKPLILVVVALLITIPMAGPASVTKFKKIFDYIPTQPTSSFQSEQFPEVQVLTHQGCQAAYRLTASFTREIRVAPGTGILLERLSK